MDVVKSSIIKAAFASALILSIGLLVGLQMDQARTDFLEDQLQETNMQTETFLVSQSYLEKSSNNYCRIMEQKVPDMAKQNAQIGRDLQSFSGKSLGSERDFEYIKKKYYVNQLKLYTLLDDYKDKCDPEVNLILFFFDESVNSQRQGAVLTEYRREVDNNTYVFSYNMETENSTILDMLKTDYSIEEGPVTVVNQDQVYREYVPLQLLRDEIE